MKRNEELARLRIENADLKQKLHDEREERRREYYEMRENPRYWVSGMYAFTTPYKDRYFHVEIIRGEVRLIEKHKDHDFILMQVPPVAPIDYSSNKSGVEDV